MKKISIIIPVYNADETIGKCLESIFLINYPNYEVIIVNDGSSDKAAEIASVFPCRIVALDRNYGAGTARNRGIKYADGEILAFTDSDCIVPSDWLGKILPHFDDSEVGGVGGGYGFCAGESYLEKFAFWELVYRRSEFPKYVSAVVSNNFACRKKIFEELGGFSEYFKGAGMEDIIFTFALSGKYKLVWDKENNVGHYFRNNLKDYLKQQYVFAYRDALVAVFIPSIASVEIFRHKNNFLQPLSFYLSHFFIFAAIYSFKFTALSFLFLSLMFIVNLNFFRFLRKMEPLFPFWKKLVYVYIRNFVWSIGLINGVAAGFLRRGKDISRVWLESYK